MTTDDITERQATGSDLFALPNAAVRSASCAPAAKPSVFSQSRVPEGWWPRAAPYFPSYGPVLVKTALVCGGYSARWKSDPLVRDIGKAAPMNTSPNPKTIEPGD